MCCVFVKEKNPDVRGGGCCLKHGACRLRPVPTAAGPVAARSPGPGSTKPSSDPPGSRGPAANACSAGPAAAGKGPGLCPPSAPTARASGRCSTAPANRLPGPAAAEPEWAGTRAPPAPWHGALAGFPDGPSPASAPSPPPPRRPQGFSGFAAPWRPAPAAGEGGAELRRTQWLKGPRRGEAGGGRGSGP